jgi:hypothetical protein
MLRIGAWLKFGVHSIQVANHHGITLDMISKRVTPMSVLNPTNMIIATQVQKVPR